MLIVRVGRQRPIKTIGEALQEAPADVPLTLLLDVQDYREKIFCQRRALRLIGQGRDRTRIIWQDGAYDVHADGRPMGTFRSYTAFFDGETLAASDLTIENAAGDGTVRGQAIAASVHTQFALFDRVNFYSMQDTLFLGPLPRREREPDGFRGPRQESPRVPSWQIYRDCRIEGDVDFVFGGADALFSGCALRARGGRPGFLSAPAESRELGFVFDRCTVEADTPHSLHLARAWRDDAKAAFLDCQVDEALQEQHFDPWNATQFTFCEYPSPPVTQRDGKVLTGNEVKTLREQTKNLCRTVEGEINQHFYKK